MILCLQNVLAAMNAYFFWSIKKTNTWHDWNMAWARESSCRSPSLIAQRLPLTAGIGGRALDRKHRAMGEEWLGEALHNVKNDLQVISRLLWFLILFCDFKTSAALETRACNERLLTTARITTPSKWNEEAIPFKCQIGHYSLPSRDWHPLLNFSGKSQTLYRYHQNEKRNNKSQKTNNKGTFMLTVFNDVWWLDEISAKKVGIGENWKLRTFVGTQCWVDTIDWPWSTCTPPSQAKAKLSRQQSGGEPIIGFEARLHDSTWALLAKLDCIFYEKLKESVKDM